MRRFLLLVLAALAVVPAAAPAAPSISALTPFPGAKREVGPPLTFRVRVPSGSGLHVIVYVGLAKKGGKLDPAAVLAQGAAEQLSPDPTLVSWITPKGTGFVERPGTYYWQAIGKTVDGSRTSASNVLSFTLHAQHVPFLIPPSVGRRSHRPFLVSRTGVPANVRGRWVALAKRSAARWGLRFKGLTTRRAGVVDRRDVVGFARAMPRSKLGITREVVARRYRVRRVCSASGCRVVSRRYVGTVVLDRDVSLNSDYRWQPGPDKPGPFEMDLETVLLHELGHFAGNPRHVQRCTDSPMMIALGYGEWWHAPGDWFVHGCSPDAGVAASVLPAFGVRRVVVEQDIG